MLRRRAAYVDADHRRVPARPGPAGAVPDRQRHPLRHGAARDLPRRRRGADQPRLSAERVRRAAAAAGARRARATGAGSITGLFTVLVEGDDSNEPVERRGARHPRRPHRARPRASPRRGRFPAIDVLRCSRAARPAAIAPTSGRWSSEARRLLRAPCRHGRADPARRLPPRQRSPDRRGDRASGPRWRRSWRRGRASGARSARTSLRLAAALGPRPARRRRLKRRAMDALTVLARLARQALDERAPCAGPDRPRHRRGPRPADRGATRQLSGSGAPPARLPTATSGFCAYLRRMHGRAEALAAEIRASGGPAASAGSAPVRAPSRAQAPGDPDRAPGGAGPRSKPSGASRRRWTSSSSCAAGRAPGADALRIRGPA